ncbi:MocR-like transcriptional regulator GabR [Pseudogracilibacillus sp. ICA-222130]|uniref:MocR-like transcriptional regulator GabR n=1 Tax=Pseudogracilibacillus sp. ICA-222130 TaxID=3134655 RepID=UPI0030BA30BD
MILIHIDKSQSASYLYQQIYKEFKNKILDRTFKAHEKLPTKRSLSEQLGISINTVANAYEQLLAEGYIYTIERSGYYVEEIAPFSTVKNADDDFPSHLREKGKNRSSSVSLSHMTADIDEFPFQDWMKCQKEAIKQFNEELSEIGHPQGPYEVRKTIAKFIALSRGVKCEPEQIVISAGTQPLVEQLMSLTDDTTTVAMESPGYPRIYSMLTNHIQLDTTLIPLDEHGANIKAVDQSNADFLFVTPSHQFPSGKIMPISRRIELLNWALKKENRYIIEDDYDSEFKYQTDNIPSLQSLDQHQRVIYFGSFSKSLLPTLRISYMVLPINLLKIYREKFSDLINYTNTLSLYTLHYFIQSGMYERHIKKMTQHYEKKRNLLIQTLKNTFKDTCTIHDIPAGLHFTASFITDKSYEEIERLAEEAKLEIYTLKRFSLNDEYKQSKNIELIIGFANTKTDEIKEAISRLYHIFHV